MEDEVERTADGRWIVVDGRRWRASDPAIPTTFHSELVHELMDARRAVGAARRADDASAEASARARVHDAKVALGERGEPWWQPTSAQGRNARLRAAVLALARHRTAKGSTICPSDAARSVGGQQWRQHMDGARDVIRTLAAHGDVEIMQKGAVIDPASQWTGPIRIRIARSAEDVGA